MAAPFRGSFKLLIRALAWMLAINYVVVIQSSSLLRNVWLKTAAELSRKSSFTRDSDWLKFKMRMLSRISFGSNPINNFFVGVVLIVVLVVVDVVACLFVCFYNNRSLYFSTFMPVKPLQLMYMYEFEKGDMGSVVSYSIIYATILF